MPSRIRGCLAGARRPVLHVGAVEFGAIKLGHAVGGGLLHEASVGAVQRLRGCGLGRAGRAATGAAGAACAAARALGSHAQAQTEQRGAEDGGQGVLSALALLGRCVVRITRRLLRACERLLSGQAACMGHRVRPRVASRYEMHAFVHTALQCCDASARRARTGASARLCNSRAPHHGIEAQRLPSLCNETFCRQRRA